MNPPIYRQFLISAAAVAFVAALLSLTIAVAGYDPRTAILALWRGSFGSWYALTSATLVRATPLLITGVAVAIAFRGGVLNIGAEGQFLSGAALATAALLAWPTLGVALIPIGMVAGLIGGLAWVAVPVLLKRRYGVFEVISTLMFNAVAGYLVAWLVRGPLQERTHNYPQTESIVQAARLPIMIPSTRLHAGFVVALVVAGAAWWGMTRTAAGFRLRCVGENPIAAASAGEIDVTRIASAAFLVSGALAGLAGAVEVQGVTSALYEALSPGYGYTAIAIALLARLNPLGAIATAVLFAALEAGATAMQRDAGVPAVLVKVVEAILILCVLAMDAWRRHDATIRVAPV